MKEIAQRWKKKKKVDSFQLLVQSHVGVSEVSVTIVKPKAIYIYIYKFEILSFSD